MQRCPRCQLKIDCGNDSHKTKHHGRHCRMDSVVSEDTRDSSYSWRLCCSQSVAHLSELRGSCSKSSTTEPGLAPTSPLVDPGRLLYNVGKCKCKGSPGLFDLVICCQLSSISGSQSPLHLCGRCHQHFCSEQNTHTHIHGFVGRRHFCSEQNTHMDLWSMYLVDVVNFH